MKDWSYRPDPFTIRALARGNEKIRRHPALGFDRPHYGRVPLDVDNEKNKIPEKRANGKEKEMATKVSKKKTPIRRARNERIPLKSICEKLDIDPKNARVRLRRAIRNGDLKFREVDGSPWNLTPKQAEAVEAYLRD